MERFVHNEYLIHVGELIARAVAQALGREL